MCNLCANKLTILKEIINKDEEIVDVRWKKYLKQVKKLSKLLEKYFLNVAEESLKDVENHVFIKKVEDDRFAERQDDFNIELQKTYKLWACFQEGEVQKEIAIWISIWISDDFTKQYAKTRIWEFISKVDDETRQEIRDIINDWMEKQQSVREVSDNIQTKFTQFSDWRASLIANTEASLAYTYGQKEHFEQYLNEFWAPWWKMTYTQWDEKVRYSHREAEKIWWIPYKQAYIDDDGEMQISNQYAPFWFRCRCVTSFWVFNPATKSVR